MSGISNTAAETKQLDARWEEKVDPYCIPIHIYDTLNVINRIITDCNNALSEAGMSRIVYSSQANEIEKIVDAIGCMNRYISAIPTDLNERIDTILYEGFNKRATETISRIHMDDFKTKNTLGLHGSWSAAGGGQIYEGTRLREDICFADFLGNNVGKETELGYNANNPIDCVQEFADLFKADYETLKSAGSLNGSEIKNLDDYLDNIEKMGEFDHKMDQPFKSFVSGLLDITIIIPFIECATGYDLITGEDLTSFELTMKGVFAVVDCLTLGTAVLAAKPFEVGGMAAVKLAGKTIAVTMASDATAYTVGYLSNQAGAPLAITMLLSMGSGIAITKVAGKYFFKNAAGELLGECNVPGESVEAIKAINQANEGGIGALNKITDAGLESKLTPASNDIRITLEKGGLTQQKIDEIVSLPKSQKPLPETYLSKEYIDRHLQSFKESGMVKIMPNKPNGTIGGRGGTFVMSADELENIIKLADGNISKIESALGFDPGYLGENPVIAKFDSASGLKMPQGNELGAYPEYWMPGGYTSGGIKEAVIDPAKEGTYLFEYLFK